MDIKVVVRTYKRQNSIMKETLGYLLNQIEPLNIYLVLADKDEYAAYKPVINQCNIADVIIGKVGGHEAINAAIDYFSEGAPLIFIDDDMRGMAMYKSIKLGQEELDENNMLKYYRYAFTKMQEYNISSLTIDYVNNLLFKQAKPFFELKPKQLGGAWWGCFNDKNSKAFQAHLDDNIRTAYFLEKDNMTASLNWLVARTAYGTNGGGMQSSGDRGLGDARLQYTKDACENAMTVDWFRKYYPRYELEKKANLYHTKILGHHELKKVIKKHEVIKFSEYFQEKPDGAGRVALDGFF